MTAPRPSGYLAHLPAVYAEADEDGFLGRFLLAAEHLLHGLGPADVAGHPPGLAAQIAATAQYLDPARTRADFLDWLAGWVAVGLAQDWTDDERRRFLGRVVPLYRMRGTAAGLMQMLRAYTGDLPVTVYEFANIPHYFQVELTLGLSLRDPQYSARAERRRRTAMAIIEANKPAHTCYAFRFRDNPTMQVGVHSTIGTDTVLSAVDAQPGTPPDDTRTGS
jgi:phage tail-like protein